MARRWPRGNPVSAQETTAANPDGPWPLRRPLGQFNGLKLQAKIPIDRANRMLISSGSCRGWRGCKAGARSAQECGIVLDLFFDFNRAR
jgi:hypothetical protein